MIANVEEAVHGALTAAGILATVKRPNPLPAGPWVRFFANGGAPEASARRRPVTDAFRVELEGYARTRRDAYAVISRALQALREAADQPGGPIRDLAREDLPVDFPTGEDNLERFVTTAFVSMRRTY